MVMKCLWEDTLVDHIVNILGFQYQNQVLQVPSFIFIQSHNKMNYIWLA